MGATGFEAGESQLTVHMLCCSKRQSLPLCRQRIPDCQLMFLFTWTEAKPGVVTVSSAYPYMHAPREISLSICLVTFVHSTSQDSRKTSFIHCIRSELIAVLPSCRWLQHFDALL